MNITSVDGNWVSGTIRVNTRLYAFSAKVYPKPSTFGVDDGHISKLTVTDERKEEAVLNYDRGWDRNDIPYAYEEIVGSLETKHVLSRIEEEVS